MFDELYEREEERRAKSIRRSNKNDAAKREARVVGCSGYICARRGVCQFYRAKPVVTCSARKPVAPTSRVERPEPRCLRRYRRVRERYGTSVSWKRRDSNGVGEGEEEEYSQSTRKSKFFRPASDFGLLETRVVSFANSTDNVLTPFSYIYIYILVQSILHISVNLFARFFKGYIYCLAIFFYQMQFLIDDGWSIFKFESCSFRAICRWRRSVRAGRALRRRLLGMQFSSDKRGAIYRVNRFLDVYVLRTNYTMPSRAMLSAWFAG